MRVGMHLGYQNLHGVPDVQTFMQETKLAIEAEAMGFDYVGPVEHHFTDYGACPDPFQLLAYIAAKTSTIDLITAAVILPWNNPLRVVEQAIELDILSEGRLILGMGRGAARRAPGFREGRRGNPGRRRPIVGSRGGRFSGLSQAVSDRKNLSQTAAILLHAQKA